MAELVDVERIVVGAPTAPEVAPDRRKTDGIVLALASATVIEAIDQDIEADDLERGKRVVDRRGRHLAGRAEAFARRRSAARRRARRFTGGDRIGAMRGRQRRAERERDRRRTQR
jgi:hypothetical protein